jgi:hypothetical protein
LPQQVHWTPLLPAPQAQLAATVSLPLLRLPLQVMLPAVDRLPSLLVVLVMRIQS